MNKILVYLLLLFLQLSGILPAKEVIRLRPQQHRSDYKNEDVNSEEDDIYRVFGQPVPSLKRNQICYRSNVSLLPSRIQCLEKTQTTNITKAIYRIYRRNKKRNEPIDIVELKRISEKISQFQFIDYALFLKCFLKLREPMDGKAFKDFVYIVEKTASFRNSSYWAPYVFRKFMKILRTNSETYFTAQTENLYIAKWSPFNTNITGHAIYKTNNETKIVPIYTHQIEKGIVEENLRLAGYIPSTFLKNSIHNFAQKRDLSIIMILVSNGVKFKEFFQIPHYIKHFIAVSISGFCKKNNLPMLMAYFNDSSPKWKAFGEDYYDFFNYKWYKCIPSRLSYFGRLNATQTGYLESVKENYCINNSTNVIPGAILRVTPVHHSIYAENICVNKDLKIPTLFCGDSGSFLNYEEVDLVCFNHTLSNHTQYLYNMLLSCYYGDQCFANPTLIDYEDTTYVDVKLHFLIMQHLRTNYNKLRINVQSLSNVLDKAVTLVEKQATRYQMLYVTSFLAQFLYCLPSFSTGRLILRDKFIYKSYQPFSDDVLGIAVYPQKDDSFLPYDIKILTSANLPAQHKNHGDAEVIAYIGEDSLKWIAKNNEFSYEDLQIHLIVIYKNDLKDNNGYKCKSRIIAVQHSKAYGEKVVFDIYLKTVDDVANPKQQWFKVRTNEGSLKMVFISEPPKTEAQKHRVN